MILFVPDGLRALAVTPQSAPTMAAVRDEGVNFANPHFCSPHSPSPNSSGCRPDTSWVTPALQQHDLYRLSGPAAAESVTPFIENDAVLGDIDAHFAGNVVDERIVKAARGQNFSTAIIGKVGPTLMFDHTERSGEHTIVVDDATGSASGIPLSQAMKDALTAAGLPLVTPGRGENGNAGNFEKPGTKVANVAQQDYSSKVATDVVLPMFKARNQPFVLVFWSRDPDGTQHNQGDSLNEVAPGINGPTTLAAVKNVDNDLAALRQALDRLGLAATTESSSRPITASRPSRSKARRARLPRPTIRMSRRDFCLQVLSRSILPRRWASPCSIPMPRMRRSRKIALIAWRWADRHRPG